MKKISLPPIYHYGSNEPTLDVQFEWSVNTFQRTDLKMTLVNMLYFVNRLAVTCIVGWFEWILFSITSEIKITDWFCT
jgi:hypothetical protein